MQNLAFKKPAFLFVLIFLAGFFVFVPFASAEFPEPAINFAPNLWFDSEEKYYPVNPLDFYFENGQEINGEKAVNKYNNLSLEQKLNNLTIFYHIQDYENYWVYEYWFFYVFNNSLAFVQNKHYGDWEAIYVFVDKDSNKIIKTIGTAHQRKIFDTEIINPRTNHIWAYVGNGSHANCIDEEDDGYCDFLKWRRLEKWDKKGSKIQYNNYKLKQITLDFIKEFKGAITLEKSPELGINIFNFLKVENKEFYIPWGGSPPMYPWLQFSFFNPEQVIPYSLSYALEKLNQAKDKIINIFKKQEADISIKIKQPELPLPEPIKSNLPETESVSVSYKEPAPVIQKIEQAPVVIKEKPEPEPVKEEQEEFIEELESPIKPPTFISGGCRGSEPVPTPVPVPVPTPVPVIPDTIPPSNIIDLLASSGNSHGAVNLSWTAPGDDESVGTATEYIIKYATSSAITSLNWASSTDIMGEPIPSLASTTENFSVNDLIAGQNYYFAIKSKDEVDNISDVSNCASATASSLSDNVVINEVQLRKHEFVELYNPTDQDIDMTGWYWSYYPCTNDWDNPYRNKEFPAGAIIPAHGSYLIGLTGYFENNYLDIDWPIYNSSLLHDKEGSIAIFPWDPTTKTVAEAKEGCIDALGWGSVNYVYEVTASAYPDIYKSLIRRIDGWDENNNNSDFIEDDLPFAKNSQGQGITIIADGISISQDTTWALAKSPYILESNSSAYPTVENNVVLTIEPGVIVKGSNKYYPSLLIKGTLKAEGTVANPITFTSATTTQLAGDWSGIVFDNTVGTDSTLDYVSFEYGGYQGSYGGTWMQEMIRINNSRVIINNSTFQHSQNGGIYLSNSNSSIFNSSFTDIGLTGIILRDYNSPSIDNCEFSNNDIGIEAILETSPIISNNTFSNNNWAIKLKSAYPALSNNQANDNNLNGVVVDQDSIFSQNVAWNDDLAYILNSGSGNHHHPTVATGTILTIEPGTVIKPSNKYYTALLIEGELIALGATSTPIIFTSLKDDAYGGDTNNDSDATVPGLEDWENIEFAAGSIGNLDYIHFRYGTAPILDIDTNATVNEGTNIVY